MTSCGPLAKKEFCEEEGDVCLMRSVISVDLADVNYANAYSSGEYPGLSPGLINYKCWNKDAAEAKIALSNTKDASLGVIATY